MKTLRCLLAAALMCGLTSAAKADPVDYQMVVIDPIPSNLVHHIFSTASPITITWNTCVASQIPTPQTYLGCFTGENDTGMAITSMTIFVPSIPNDVAACAKYGSGLDIFSSVTCSTSASGSFLYLTGGNIPTSDFGPLGEDRPCRNEEDDDCGPDADDQASLFTIAEAGFTADQFPVSSAVLNSPAPTPEPNSLLLLSTGLLSGGGMVFRNWKLRNPGRSSR